MKPLLIAMCIGLSASAQSTVNFNVSFPSEARYENMKTFVKPLSEQSTNAIVELNRSDNGIYTGTTSADPIGIYTVYASNDRSQYSLPVYVAPGSTDSKFEVSIDGFVSTSTLDDPSNKALQAYTADYTNKAIELNKNFAELTDQQVKDILIGFTTSADSIASAPNLPKNVADYIRLWGYVSASDAYNMAMYLTRGTDRSFSFQLTDILPPANKVLDTPMAVYFPSSVQSVLASLPKGTVEERLQALYDMYSTPEIRSNATSSLVSSFIDSVDYSGNFDESLQRLTAIVEKYALPTTYLDTFNSRRATIAGTPFPSVELVDRDGNKVDFSKFRGKYVYVDLWASWCGPCVKEVPYLQKLEKELEDSDVVFVSISIDSTREPWLKKMEQLNMHGNQLWNSDENLPKQLNVKGIPHFLIYDREGKLHTYKALRPSNPELADMLRSLK